MRPTRAAQLCLALLPPWLLVLLACAASTPMKDDVPAGERLPIDGEWRETTAPGARFRIEAGRMWALEPYVSGGLWQVRAGQIELVNLKRTGPRTYIGWHLGYKGPYYLSLVGADRMAVLLRLPAGDYQSVLEKLSVDDATAFAAELDEPVPALPWEDPLVMSGQLANAHQSSPDPSADRSQSAGVARAAATASPSASLAETTVPEGTDFGRYHALLIGNDAYRELPRLQSAGADVHEIARVLREQYGFEITLLEDASRDDVLLALERYRRDLSESDNLLVYYAGHGWLDEEADEGYWLPVDASPDSSINWIPNATLTSSFKAIRAKHVLVVADSCYSGKLTRGIAVRPRRAPDYIARMARKRARMVISSGGLEPVLDSGRGGHSVFAAAFLDALRANHGVLDTTSLFSQIRRDVMLHADQTPELADIRKSGHEGGDFLFVPQR
jgi:hypothetical protein